jgi:hypothetical protein
MPSTYSNLKIQLMATGENSTTWGNVTNLNLGTAIEEAIAGSADVTFASANVTLTLTDTNTSQTARNMRLRCTGTTGGSTRNLVVPAIEKAYMVQNDCADSVVVKNATGTGITVPAGKTMWVYNDGTNVVDAVTRLSSLTLGTALAVTDGGTGRTFLTGNYLLRGNDGGAVNSSVIYDNGTNVGIGTSSPGQALDVVGSIRASSTLLAAAIQTGYGVSTGDCAVEIGGDRTGSGPSYVDFHSTSGTDFEARILRNSGANGDFGITNTGTGFLTINNIGFGAVVLGTNNTERVRITPTGNVGIGTSTPATSLDINGSQITRGDANGFILFAPKEGTEPFGTNYDRFEIRVDDTAQVTTLGNTNGGTGSARALAFLAGTNERMRIDTAGNVGIGTTSPARLFEVVASGTNIPARFGNSQGNLDIGGSDGNTVNIDTRSWAMALQTGGTERMRIDTSGNVGIGTSTPGQLLTVRYDHNGTTAALIQNRNASGSPAAALQFISGAFDLTDDRYAMIASAGGANNTLQFYTSQGATPTEKMRIDSGGNVGIGTSTPAAKLSIDRGSSGQIFTFKGAGGTFGFASGVLGGTNACELTTTDTGGVQATRMMLRGGTDNADIEFYRGARGAETISMFIEGDTGNVGIGTTSPAYTLDVVGDQRAAGLLTLKNDLLLDKGALDTIYCNTALAFARNGVGERMRIDSSGNVGIGTASPARRLSLTASAYASAELSSAVTASPSTLDAGEVFTLSSNTAISGVTFSPSDPRLLTFGVTPTNAAYMRANELDLVATGAIRLTTGGGTERFRIGSSGQIGLSGTNYGTSGQVLTSQGSGSAPIWTSITPGTGTVTSVSFTGGIVSVGTPTTTPAFTVAGTSGGIPYFSSASTWATSAALAANAIVVGGGAGVAPSTITTGTGVVTALGVNTGTAGAFVVNGGALGTPSSGTLTNCTFPTLNQNTTGSAATLTTARTLTIGATGKTFNGSANVTWTLAELGAAASGANTDITSLATTTTINGVTIGYRSIPRSTTTTTAVVGDVGKCIAVTAGITIPNSTFAAGDALSIYNDSASAITITAGVTTLRQAGTANTGNRTLAARGMATVWFNSATEAIISGSGLT